MLSWKLCEGFCHEILTDPTVGGQPNGARTVFVYFTVRYDQKTVSICNLSPEFSIMFSWFVLCDWEFSKITFTVKNLRPFI